MTSDDGKVHIWDVKNESRIGFGRRQNRLRLAAGANGGPLAQIFVMGIYSKAIKQLAARSYLFLNARDR